ncbi:MAG: hypothetical protein MZV65_16550 [Chromatiales bacterium]|nr:hypothetical protein [Chromatiales bacterium]
MACALLPLLGVSSIKLMGSVDYIAAVYALAIVSFMAGAHWGTASLPAADRIARQPVSIQQCRYDHGMVGLSNHDAKNHTHHLYLGILILVVG